MQMNITMHSDGMIVASNLCKLNDDLLKLKRCCILFDRYEDEEVPFLARWGKNAVEGELRKIFELADAMRPGGPRFGRWAGVVRPPPGSGPPKMVCRRHVQSSSSYFFWKKRSYR